MHFEELWEAVESLHKGINPKDISLTSILDQISIKINLFKLVAGQETTQQIKEEQDKAKEMLMGEILMTMANLSLLTNIDVGKALSNAYRSKQEELIKSIPPELRLPKI